MELRDNMFESFKISKLVIKNRLIGSAMFEFGAEEGRITDRIKGRYQELANGGAGLVISGMQAISDGAGISPLMVQTSYENYENDMGQIADMFHKNGSRLFVQLQHAGYRTAWKHGYDTLGVSELQISEECTYREATQEDINQICENFGKAARRCKAAGCDGVQIHAAHGFLINTFLSPHYNHRTDNYGGTIENRARLLFEVYDSIRRNVGNDYPVSVKISFSDLVCHSITPEESVWVCKELEDRSFKGKMQIL